jgi:hypothetical protein
MFRRPQAEKLQEPVQNQPGFAIGSILRPGLVKKWNLSTSQVI